MSTAPGPWKRDQYGTVVDANGRDVRFRSVSICCSGNGVQEAEENTDLIAAAPELLAALLAIAKEAGSQFGNDDGPGSVNRMAYLARAAIAKATGTK